VQDEPRDPGSVLVDVEEPSKQAISALVKMKEMLEPEDLVVGADTTQTSSVIRNSVICHATVGKLSAEAAPSTSTQYDSNSFFVDLHGQQPSSISRQRLLPVLRSPSPAASEYSSGEEEIVFRGRNIGVQVVDDPVSGPMDGLSSLNASITATQTVGTTGTWNTGSTPWIHRSKPEVGWTVPRVVAKPQTHSHEVMLPGAEEDLSLDRSPPPTSRSINTAITDRSSRSTQSISSSSSEAAFNRVDDDDVLQDYIDNMKGQDSDSDIDLSTFQPRELDISLSNTHRLLHASTSHSEHEAGDLVQRQLFEAKHAEVAESSDEKDEKDETSEDENDSIDDDIDLIERRMAQLDDENIARLLAKQDELGILTDDLVLFDDDAVAEAAHAYSKISPKSARRVKKNVETSLVIDVKDNAYDDFDIMDLERPSLQRKKGKGKRTEPIFDGVDSDVAEKLKKAWNNDREVKKAKKEAREELRTQGLLGRRKKGKADLAEKYSEGLSIQEFKEELEGFLNSPHQTLSLPPMGKNERKMVHELAAVFGLRSKSTGQGLARYPSLVKTRRTVRFNERDFLVQADQIKQGFFPRLDKHSAKSFAGRLEKASSKSSRGSRGGGRTGGGGGNSAGVTYREGEVVGASAAEISTDNRGRIMLEKMGWSQGTGLGTDRAGIQVPIAHIVKNTKAGLG
jgi:hypothetical protein